MNIDSQNTSASKNNEVRIDADWSSAIMLALSSKVTLIWLGFGLFITVACLFKTFEAQSTLPSQSTTHTWIFAAGYWMLTLPFGAIQIIRAIRIARHGVVVPGIVEDITIIGFATKRAHRINVNYKYSGISYKAIANPMGRDPEPGSIVLVAIHPDKPKLYRLVPYDFKLDKQSINDFKSDLGYNRGDQS